MTQVAADSAFAAAAGIPVSVGRFEAVARTAVKAGSSAAGT